MGTRTTNYKLWKPALTDDADVSVLDGNWEQIDKLFKSLNDSVKEIDDFIRKVNWASGFDANKAMITDSQGQLKASSVDSGLLLFLTNLRSNVQQQIDDLSSNFTTTITNINTEIQTVKTSVSNGKSAIARAITDKGVSTSDSDSFATITGNIDKIDTAPADGKKWTQTGNVLSAQHWSCVEFVEDRFLMIAGCDTRPSSSSYVLYTESDKCAYSFDGLNWTEVNMPIASSWMELAYGNGIVIALVRRGYKDSDWESEIVHTDSYPNGRVAISHDLGLTWTTLKSLSNTYEWCGLTYGNGRFVAFGHGTAASATRDESWESSAMSYSTNGTSWTIKTLPVSAAWADSAFGNNMFVAIAEYSNDSETDIALYSTDGINWTQTTMPVSARWCAVTYGKGRFVAVSKTSDNNGRYYAAYSDDGISWTLSNGTKNMSIGWSSNIGLSYVNGKFLKYREYSVDGTVWQDVEVVQNDASASIAYGNGIIVSVDEGSGTRRTLDYSKTTND